jgi:hypothetical protein
MHRGDARDELAVELLRERREVEPAGPQAGLDVRDRDPEMEGGERGGERRRRVAVHDRSDGIVAGQRNLARRPLAVLVGEASQHVVLEAAHHRGHALVEARVPTTHQQIDVRCDAGQPEHLGDHVVVLAGRHHDRPEAGAALERQDQRDQLDRLGAGAHDDQQRKSRSIADQAHPPANGTGTCHAGTVAHSIDA